MLRTKTSYLSTLNTLLRNSNNLDPTCVDAQRRVDRPSIGLERCRSDVQVEKTRVRDGVNEDVRPVQYSRSCCCEAKTWKERKRTCLMSRYRLMGNALDGSIVHGRGGQMYLRGSLRIKKFHFCSAQHPHRRDDESSGVGVCAGVVSIALTLGLKEIWLSSELLSLISQSQNHNGQWKLNRVSGPSSFHVIGIC